MNMNDPLWFRIKNGNYDFGSFIEDLHINNMKERLLIYAFSLCCLYNKDPFVNKKHVIAELLDILGENALKYVIIYQLIKKVWFRPSSDINEDKIEYFDEYKSLILNINTNEFTIEKQYELIMDTFYLMVKAFFPYNILFPLLEEQKNLHVKELNIGDFFAINQEIQDLSVPINDFTDYNLDLYDDDELTEMYETCCNIITYFNATKEFIEMLRGEKIPNWFLINEQILSEIGKNGYPQFLKLFAKKIPSETVSNTITNLIKNSTVEFHDFYIPVLRQNFPQNEILTRFLDNLYKVDIVKEGRRIEEIILKIIAEKKSLSKYIPILTGDEIDHTSVGLSFIEQVKKYGLEIAFNNKYVKYLNLLKGIFDYDEIIIKNETSVLGENIFNYPYSELEFIKVDNGYYCLTREEIIKGNGKDPYSRKEIAIYSLLKKFSDNDHKSLTFKENWENVLKRRVNILI